ncbi:replication protein A [Chimaeribacter californicus]|uniref:Replication protein A n=1 Tax=Chimaeribacter californicus TaxID=2060067 RepID=A0A2N5EEH9_9GAMM|nr:replication endonuclease [Chimaeribacter californicus]PLR40916.1 replication protein A [Chimaeribacter californicus]
MPDLSRGRRAPAPPPPFNVAVPLPFSGAYPWNRPRPAVSRPRALTRAAWQQAEQALDQLNHLPRCLRAPLLNRYQQLLQENGYRAAHHFLLTGFAKRLWPRISRVMARHQMDFAASARFTNEAEAYHQLPDLNDKAVRRLARRIAGQLHEAYESACDALPPAGEEGPARLLNPEIQRRLYGQVAPLARAFNLQPPHWAAWRKGRLSTPAALAAILRLVDGDWWETTLLRQRTCRREALMIAAGYVSRALSPYVSKQALRDVTARRLSNLSYLKHHELENEETGERLNLLDTVMASVANPAIRRMELMTLIAGVEQTAEQQGHGGLFITLTTPAKYHPMRTLGSGRRVQINAAWQGHSPKEAQRYLVAVWAKIRTAFKDNCLPVYGLRVVEPHHDGTPHWHLLLFMAPHQQTQVIAIMRRYSLQEDGDEPGAAERRCTFKPLNRGGAAGYIAKYIAKNIDGYALEGEKDHDTGKPLTQTAAAVTAWAATWRIPQFHPIGLPGIGAYRECRRIRHLSLAGEFDAQVEAVRQAADSGDFAGYIRAQGGTNVPRNQQTVRVARRHQGEYNAYEEPRRRVVGIYAPHLGDDRLFLTRSARWHIVPRAAAGSPLTLSGNAAPWSSVNNCGEPAAAAPPFIPDLVVGTSLPRINIPFSGRFIPLPGPEEPETEKYSRDHCHNSVMNILNKNIL